MQNPKYPKVVSTRLSENEIDRLEAICNKFKTTKSEFIRMLLNKVDERENQIIVIFKN